MTISEKRGKGRRTAAGLPIGVCPKGDGSYMVRVTSGKKLVEQSQHRDLRSALEALCEARIDVHNRHMIEIDRAMKGIE